MSYDVFTKDGTPAGKLTVTQKGPRTVFEYQSDSDPGVSRLVLISGHEAHSLGIPIQRAGGLYLKKTLTRLERADMRLGDEFTALLTPADEVLSRLAAAQTPEKTPDPAPEDTPASAPETETEPAKPVMETAPPMPEEKPKPAPEPEERPKPMPEPEEKPTPTPEPEERPTPAPEPEEKPMPTPEPEESPKPTPEPEPGSPCPAPRKPQWREEPDPGKYFSDPALKSSAARCPGALVMDAEDGGVTLAFPWTPSSPFPMLEIFRLCSTVSIGGTDFITYCVKDGEPV